MRQNNRIFYLVIISLFLIIFLSSTLFSQESEHNLIHMNFREVEVREVLRAIAEMAEVNLLVDDSVQGEITIRLWDVNFEQALRLLTQFHNLAYKWDDNTVVVASAEKIHSIYASTAKVQVNHANLETLQDLILNIFPDIKIQIDERNQQFIISDLDDKKVKQVITLIQELDTPLEKDEFLEIVNLKLGIEQEIREIINNIYPSLKVFANELNQQLILYGEKDLIVKAKILIEELDNPEYRVANLEIYQVRSNDLEGLNTIINSIYPDLKVFINQVSNSLIFYGDESLIKKALNLTERLDISETEKKAETLIEAVSVQTKELAELVANIQRIYPDVTIVENKGRNQLILSGNKNEIRKVLSLIELLDYDPLEGIEVSELVKINEIELDFILDNVKNLYPELTIYPDDIRKQLIIVGEKRRVDKALTLIQQLDQPQEIVEIIKVDYMDLESVAEMVRNTITGINIQLNQEERIVLVKGRESRVEQALTLIKRLDIPRRQVIIEVRVEEISRNELTNIGISSSELSQISFMQGESGQISGLDMSWPKFINMLREEGKSKTLANPRLMTISGQEAKLLIGDRVAYRTEIIEDDRVVSQVQHLEIGVSLEFKPWVSEDDYITIEVRPQVSSISGTIAGDIPSVNTREAETIIRLKDGQTFAIGGLIQNDIIESVSKVPLLSELPILGEIFKHRRIDDRETELLIIITPTIVE